MPAHRTVGHEAWIAARKELLAREKAFTRMRDELSRARRDLPWETVDKDYVFDGPDGRESLAELFADKGQLLVQHFMFGPDWEEGCPSCSLMADHIDPAVVHLGQRDVAFVAVSRAPLAKIEAFRARMGWSFKWVSSAGSDFNAEFGVSFSPEAVEAGAVEYNYATGRFPSTEAPGLSTFCKDEAGQIYHAYSTYGRGLDTVINAYNLLDLMPKGRDEDGLDHTMAWVRHHDRYGT